MTSGAPTMATSSSSFVEIRDGVSLETRQYGDATGSKALVVWGHGLCNSLEGEDEDMLWNFWAKKTVGEGNIDGPSSTDDDAGAIEMGANVVRYSARGHGESSPSTAPADCAWDTLGGDMLDLARRQRRDASQKLILGGASMGAASAIHAAVRVQRERERAGSDPVSNPNEIAGLVLVIVPTFHESRRRRRTQILAAAERGYDSFYKSKKPRPIFRGTDREDEPPRLVGVREDSFVDVMTASADSDLPPPDVIVNALKDLPVLALCWDCGDRTHPAESAAALKERLAPHADVRIATCLEETRGWSDAVRRFVRGLCE